jgi:heat shock protein HslJ
MKYLLLFVTICIMSCGDPSATTKSEPTATPMTSAPPAPDTSAQTTPVQVSSGTQSPLTGTYWKLMELNGKNMEGKTAKEMYLFLAPDSPQFKSHSGCNLIMGEAKFTGTNHLQFTNLLNTTSECKTPDIDAEFLKTMEAISGYAHKGNILLLTKGGSVTGMKFMAKG